MRDPFGEAPERCDRCGVEVHGNTCVPQNVRFLEVFQRAEAAALEAGRKVGDLPYCGFAWVEIRPATLPFAKWCRKAGKAGGRFGDELAYNGGIHILWCPAGQVQSMDAHEAAARAAVQVLEFAGIPARSGSRAD